MTCEPEVLIPGILFVARGWLKDPEGVSSSLMDETDGTWAVHRGFKGRPVYDRITTRHAAPGVTSTFGCGRTGKERPQKVYPWKDGGIIHLLSQALEGALKQTFNFVYCNIYIDGGAGIARHCDRGFMELRAVTTIASLSFGESRTFRLTSKADGREVSTVLHAGDLAVMHGRCQLDWLHSVPREKHVQWPRLSLTFRHHHPKPPKQKVIK